MMQSHFVFARHLTRSRGSAADGLDKNVEKAASQMWCRVLAIRIDRFEPLLRGERVERRAGGSIHVFYIAIGGPKDL